MTTALELSHIRKNFGPVMALRDASLVARAGTVHALLGENGAGKTTLMRITYGLERPDDGRVIVHGVPGVMRSPRHAIAAGIGMVHQHSTAVRTMTVAENVALGGTGLYHCAGVARLVERTSVAAGLPVNSEARVENLSVAAQQRVEIVKALAHGARLLVLDEPTALLAPQEIESLFAFLRRFAEGGGTVIMITHKIREALAIAEDVTVLRAGSTVWTGRTEDTTLESLARAMIGVDAIAPSRDDSGELGAPVLVVENITVQDARGRTRVRGANLTVHGGEIVGIAGLEGSGHHELLLALVGIVRSTTGRLVRPSRVAFIPADRQREALVLDFALDENIALRGSGSARGRMRWRTLTRLAQELVARFRISAPSGRVPVRTLSGGNQQKVVLARELYDAPPGVIAENPLRGLDIAAAAETQELLLTARRNGAAIVFYSSDLDEVLAIADRVVVMYDGVPREVARDREIAGRALLGLA